MEPFRETLVCYLEQKRAELRAIEASKPSRAKKTEVGGADGGDDDQNGVGGSHTGPVLDYATSKTLRTIKDHISERHKRMKSLKHVKESPL